MLSDSSIARLRLVSAGCKGIWLAVSPGYDQPNPFLVSLVKQLISAGAVPTTMEATVDQLSAYELERGKPMPDTIHAAIQSNLIFELKSRYRGTYRGLSELSLATIPDSTTPDIAIYPAFSLDYAHRTAKRSDAPLACIEIQSPSQSNEEMVDKTGIYFTFGVKSCWIVVPAMKGVFIYDQPGHYTYFHGDDTLRDPNLSIEIPLSTMFE